MQKKAQNKMIDGSEAQVKTKDIVEVEQDFLTEEYHFKAKGDRAAVTIKAKSIEEATQKYFSLK